MNLEVSTCDEPIIWEIHSETVFQQVRELRVQLNEASTNLYFGVGRNGVRERAWGRIVGGHLDLTTLRSSTCNCRTPTGIDRVRIILQ